VSEALKPPFTYFGGKTAIAGRIVSLLPPHEHYVEPFAGSLAVLLAKPPGRMETVNDLDGDLMTFWRVLRDRPAELIRACALTPHSRAEYLGAYEPASDDLERARRTWVIISQGRSGTLKRTGWRVQVDPAVRTGSLPGELAGYVGRMEWIAQRLSNVTLECRPALDLIRTHGALESSLLYIDPPYLGTSRSGGLNYRHEMPGETEHRELAAALADCRATVVVSGYQTQLYAALFGGWHVAQISSGSGQGSVWKDRTEVLWSNRPFPQGSLFDHLEAS
jgi:DNA adenine methylase